MACKVWVAAAARAIYADFTKIIKIERQEDLDAGREEIDAERETR